MNPVPIIILPSDTDTTEADHVAEAFRQGFPSTPFELYVGTERRA